MSSATRITNIRTATIGSSNGITPATNGVSEFLANSVSGSRSRYSQTAVRPIGRSNAKRVHALPIRQFRQTAERPWQMFQRTFH